MKNSKLYYLYCKTTIVKTLLHFQPQKISQGALLRRTPCPSDMPILITILPKTYAIQHIQIPTSSKLTLFTSGCTKQSCSLHTPSFRKIHVNLIYSNNKQMEFVIDFISLLLFICTSAFTINAQHVSCWISSS